MKRQQALPTGNSLTNVFARELARLLGPSLSPADGTRIAEDLRVFGESFSDAYSSGSTALDESFVSTAEHLIREWETRLGVTTNESLTLAERRALLVAKRRAGGGNTEEIVSNALLALEVGASVIQNKAADVTATPRKVFMMAVLISVADWNEPQRLQAIKDLLGQMVPAHVEVNVATRTGFRCDDPLSLLDRDLLET